MDTMNFSSQMPPNNYSKMNFFVNNSCSAILSDLLTPVMPGLLCADNRVSEMCFKHSIPQDTQHQETFYSKSASHPASRNIKNTLPDNSYVHGLILPGLPDDVAKHCLALVPRSCCPPMGAVSKTWRYFIKSQEFLTIRRLAGVLEEWLYLLTVDVGGKGNHWEVLDPLGQKHCELPPMPGPVKTGFGLVVLNRKLLVIAGYSLENGNPCASEDVYQYDSYLNSWTKLAKMNLARYDFACAEVNGMVFAVGGYGVDGESLSCSEMYDPVSNKWTIIESLRRPRYGCFACGFAGKLYVMGGRSKFSIGNFKKVDVYNPEDHTWRELKNGCVMVTTHAMLGKELFCIEWKNQRKLAIFNPEEDSWKMVPIPVTGSTTIGFRLGILDGKLLLFSLEDVPGYKTLLYDPNALPGKEWQTSHIKPSGSCLCSVTIKA